MSEKIAEPRPPDPARVLSTEQLLWIPGVPSGLHPQQVDSSASHLGFRWVPRAALKSSEGCPQDEPDLQANVHH